MSSSTLELGDEETSSADLTARDTGQAEDSTGGQGRSPVGFSPGVGGEGDELGAETRVRSPATGMLHEGDWTSLSCPQRF